MPFLYLHPRLVLISVVLKSKCWKHPLVIFPSWGPELTPIVRAPACASVQLFIYIPANVGRIFNFSWYCSLLRISRAAVRMILCGLNWKGEAIWIGCRWASEFFWRSSQQRERGFYQNSVGSSRLLIEGSFILARSNLKKIKCPTENSACSQMYIWYELDVVKLEAAWWNMVTQPNREDVGTWWSTAQINLMRTWWSTENVNLGNMRSKEACWVIDSRDWQCANVEWLLF